MRNSAFVFLTAAALAALVGCNAAASKESQISRYRQEIVNGVGRSFSDADTKFEQKEEFFVAPSGKLSNPGTKDQPWDLKTALRHPKEVHAGAVIWLMGGTYNGAFVSELIGQKGAPIVVRQFPGERAILDGCIQPPTVEPTLLVKGEYTWFWGFEITNCEKKRITRLSGPDPADIFLGTGVDVRGTDIKLINLAIHDTGGGIGAWTSAKRTEISGNIVYYNGFDGPERGHGHGIYVQNELGPKHLINNIVFDQFGSGIHAYGEKGTVSTLHFDGNILFNNGSLSERSGFSRNILIGGHKPAEGLTVQSNATYYPMTAGGANIVGYDGGCDHLTLLDNYFAGPDAMTINNCQHLKIQGNSFTGSKPVGMATYDFPENVVTMKPTGQVTQLHVDRWEPGRAILAVFNWDKRSHLRVDVSQIGWQPGQRYLLRNVEDFFGDAVKGTYNGDVVEVPMVGWTKAVPVGRQSAPSSTLPEFGAFVLEMDNTPPDKK